MLHLIHAARHIWRNKVYSFVILLSLSIGFSCTGLLISFLISETRTDSFHRNAERTFQIFSNDPFGGKGRLAYLPYGLSGYVRENYPEAEKISQVSALPRATLRTAAGQFGDMTMILTDSSFFSIFDFPVKGRRIGRKFSAGDIILTEEKAMILFGRTDVWGEAVELITADTSRLLTVYAVIGRTGDNSHLKFDVIANRAILRDEFTGGATYVLLRTAAAAEPIATKLNDDVKTPSLLGDGVADYFLEPIRNSYFNADNKLPFIKTRSELLMNIGYVVCLLVFFMASFNFVNLFLLSLRERQSETGIRKTLGASIVDLIRASSVEAILYVSMAFSISLLVTGLLLPYFNFIMGADLALPDFFRPATLLIIVFAVLLLSLVLVIAATLQQWKVRSVNLVRTPSRTAGFNRLLFTTQFIISSVLVICAATIILQIDHVEHAPLGFNRKIIQINSFDENARNSLQAFKQTLLQMKEIDGVTLASGNPISGNAVIRYNLENGEVFAPFLFSGDEDFLKTLDIRLVEGKMPSRGSGEKLVNRTLVRKFGMTNPIGEQIPGTKDKILGVVEDFTCSSFKTEIPPVIISYSSAGSCLLVSFDNEETASLLADIRASWSKIFPDEPFSYRLLQDDLVKKYKDDIFFYRLIIAFSLTSIAISCFGLFALSWSVTQRRMREIGIRKVLGANAGNILYLLSAMFMKRIIISFLISAPIGYYFMELWLANFSNRISFGGGIFLSAAGIVFLIAFATIFFQVLKAAVTNPVNELREK